MLPQNFDINGNILITWNSTILHWWPPLTLIICVWWLNSCNVFFDFFNRIFEKVAPPAFTPFRKIYRWVFEKPGLRWNWICGILLSKQILISYDGAYYFKINHNCVPIPTTNYTTNYPELRQAQKLHKVKLSITIIIIEKLFRMYHNKWRAWQTINSYYQLYN